MDTARHHREIVAALLREEKGGYAIEGLRREFVVSANADRFILFRNGWFRDKNYYALIQDVEVREDGTVLIHADNTDQDLAEDLIAAGIPATAIRKAYDPDQAPPLSQAKPAKPAEAAARRVAA